MQVNRRMADWSLFPRRPASAISAGSFFGQDHARFSEN
jgi:hypothetical protein